jgi:TonB family protein
MIFKPNIEYPAEASRAGLGGTGIVVVAVDRETGLVTGASMLKSTGHAILDLEALRCFRLARFTKGCPSRVKIPIAFTPSRKARRQIAR